MKTPVPGTLPKVSTKKPRYRPRKMVRRCAKTDPAPAGRA